jgi:protein tyrosine phosphatase
MLAHIKPMHVPEEYLESKLVSYYPPFLQDICRLSPKSRAVKVNTEFFDVEQREQRRLQGILDWHCQQSVTAPVKSRDDSTKDSDVVMKDKQDEHDQDYHPFSISAGVEKGHLNRYKNMWPVGLHGLTSTLNADERCEIQYEHARVRLHRDAEPASGDYINASHIRLRGSGRHYIASQGPLESTTEHFWQLVLQEKVTTIVMLTLLAEGGREKCYNYFKTAEYDTVSVKVTEEKGDNSAMQESINDNFGFFGMDAPLPSQTDKRDKDSSKAFEVHTPSSKGRSSRLDAATVRRTLEIRNKRTPAEAPFIVTHIQYIRWPDFDIPPDPGCVVDLIHETNRAKQISGHPNAPILVHCSAGVGRTGSK